MKNLEIEVGRLRDVLEAEEALYGELRLALQNEHACLVNLEADGLDEAVQQKETLVTEARALEEGRRAIVIRIGSALGHDVSTLTELCERLGDEAEPLREPHSRLLGLVAAVRKLLEINASFAGEAMGQVRATLELLGRLAPQEATYRADGLGTGHNPGRLVRQSA